VDQQQSGAGGASLLIVNGQPMPFPGSILDRGISRKHREFSILIGK